MKTWRTHAGRHGGFTLLEVLIATVAFAIVLAAINAVFYAALRLRNRTVESFEQSRPLDRALSIIKSDLVHLLPPGGTFAGPLQTTAITNSIAGQVSPDFYTTTGQLGELSPWGDVQKVSYALMPGEGNRRGQDLVRAVTRNLLPAAFMEPPVEQWLLGGVETIRFSYYDGLQWREWWDSQNPDPQSGATNTLPLAIKVEIQLASEGSGGPLALQAPVEIIAPILAQSLTSGPSESTP